MAEYIDREKLLRDIDHYHVSDGKFQHWVEIQFAEDVSPVVHGEWICKPISGYSSFICSKCRTAYSDNNGRWNYCPNCGAKMGEEAQNEKPQG